MIQYFPFVGLDHK